MSLTEIFNAKESSQDGRVATTMSSTAAEAYSKDLQIDKSQQKKEQYGNALDFSIEDIYEKISFKRMPVDVIGKTQVLADAKDAGGDFKKAKDFCNSLLGDKKDVALPNGFKVTKTSADTFDIDIQGTKFHVDTKNDTIRSDKPNDKVTHTLSTDKDGNIVVLTDDKKYDSNSTTIIKKDGTVIIKASPKEDPSDVEITEHPAHGAWVMTSHEEGDQKATVQRFSKLDAKKPFKDAAGSEIEFKDNGSKQGRVIVKTADGKTLSLDDGTLTITDKDGVSKKYGYSDGKTVSRPGETRSDWYVEFPGGVVANVGHGGGSIEIKNSDGSTTTAVYGNKSPYVVVAKPKP